MKPSAEVPLPAAFPSADVAAFLVGQDREGHWLAIQASGKRGGMFTSKEAAVHYARDQTERRVGAVRFVAVPLRLV